MSVYHKQNKQSQREMTADSNEEFASLLSKAQSGDAESQFKVAQLFEKGTSEIQVNVEEAEKWYLLAAEQGYNMFDVGQFYLRNDNPVTAEKWLVKGAERGHFVYALLLANDYANPLYGLPLDIKKAYFWFSILEIKRMQTSGLNLEYTDSGEKIVGGFNDEREILASFIPSDELDELKRKVLEWEPSREKTATPKVSE